MRIYKTHNPALDYKTFHPELQHLSAPHSMQCNVVSIAGSLPRSQFNRLLLRQAPKPCHCSKEEKQHRAIKLMLPMRNTPQWCQKNSQESLLSFLPHSQQTPRRPRAWAAVDGRILISDCPSSLVLLLLSVWPYSLPYLAAPHSDNLHINPAL